MPLCTHIYFSSQLSLSASGHIKFPFYIPHMDKSPNCCWSGKKRRAFIYFSTLRCRRRCARGAGRIPRNAAYIKQTQWRRPTTFDFWGGDATDTKNTKKNKTQQQERFLLSGQSHDRCTMALIEPSRSEIILSELHCALGSRRLLQLESISISGSAF